MQRPLPLAYVRQLAVLKNQIYDCKAIKCVSQLPVLLLLLLLLAAGDVVEASHKQAHLMRGLRKL